MLDLILRSGSFVFIIFLGWFLRKVGFFKREDFTILARITIRVTLPCTIITSFAGKEFDLSLLSLAFIALGCGIVYMLLGYLLNRKGSPERRAFGVLNLAGYNIGTFVIPFAQAFLDPICVIVFSLFDTGNAFIGLGGAYSVASMVQDGRGFSPKRIIKALLTSPPFVCYIVMLLMNLGKLPVPDFVLSVAQIGANANAFMAMLTIGVGFQLQAEKSQLWILSKMLLVRYGVAAVVAAAFYFLLPFSLEVRQALVILAVSPIASAATGFTGELKNDVGLSSALNSLSIVISIVLIITLILIMA